MKNSDDTVFSRKSALNKSRKGNASTLSLNSYGLPTLCFYALSILTKLYEQSTLIVCRDRTSGMRVLREFR